MDITLDIPHDLLITTDNNRLATIVESMYPFILDNINEVYFSQTRAILVPNHARLCSCATRATTQDLIFYGASTHFKVTTTE